MTQNTFAACISQRPRKDDDGAVSFWADFWGNRIAPSLSAVSELLDQLDAESELPEDLMALFSAVLEAMRMNRENLEKDAVSIFILVEDWLDGKSTSKKLSDVQNLAFCQAFIRAGLEPPDTIRQGLDTFPTGDLPVDLDMPDIGALIEELIPADVGGYPAYMILREGVGAMPRAATALFVSQMVAQAEPKLISLGYYFLLDQMAELRAAAAEGFADLSDAGSIDAGVLSELIRIRKWLPDQQTKTSLDRAIKGALRREPTGGSVPRPWTLHRLLSSLPDGTGSQSIMASVSRGGQKCIVVLLLKTGHGIKDAYAIPCTSATDQRTTLAEIEDQVTMHEVAAEYLPDALAIALRDGLEKGLPPAPAFVDVSGMLGLEDLSPHDDISTAFTNISDPAGLLNEMSAAERKKLVRHSAELARDHDISSSWFVTNSDLSSALARAETEQQAKHEVWEHLETQRAFWSSQFARSASVLHHAGIDDWKAFAALVQDVAAGGTLNEIPIFEVIAEMTLDFAAQDSFGAADLDDELLDDLFGDDDDETGVEPEKRGEFSRLLKKTPLSPDLIEGYLTGIIVAPCYSSPTDWLPPLLEGVSFPGGNKLQRVIDIIMLRYGIIQDDLYGEAIGTTFKDISPKKLGDWLAGFAQASAVSTAWPKRALSKDDRKVISLIIEGVDDEAVRATLKPLLPSWLDAMGLKAVDG